MHEAYITSDVDFYASRIYIFVMCEKRMENMLGALALGLSDSLQDGADGEAPEPGQAAAAITLLRHEPGMPIERLRRALSLSHPGAVRLVDRLVADALAERRPGIHDRRTVALHLTEAGEQSCTRILAARSERMRYALDGLTTEEREIFARLTAKMLATFVRDEPHAYSVCRLCDTQACTDCPVEAGLHTAA